MNNPCQYIEGQLPFGSPRCQCTVCCKLFKSSAGFDKHRVGSYESGRKCLTEAQMRSKGMDRTDKGLWVTEKYVFPTPVNAPPRHAA